MINRKRFAENFRRIMKEKNVTQKDVIDRTELGQNLVSLYARGGSMPSSISLAKIGLALGVSLDDLMEGVIYE